MDEVVGRLAELEAVIERGLQTFVEVGNAIREIRDSRLYRERYATFEDYCRERWGWGRNYANKQVVAADTAALVGTNVPIANEAQARALAPLAREDPEAARAVWEEAVREAESEGRRPTAEAVKERVAAGQAPPGREPQRPTPPELERKQEEPPTADARARRQRIEHAGYQMRVLLRHLNKWLDPGTYGPEEAALALARMEDGPELTEGLRARAAWLVRVAEEVERARADGDENEDEEREKEHQARIIRGLDKEERSSFYQAIMELGGIKTHDNELREEYRAIPNAYKSKNGLAGDVIANLLAQHHPQFGVADERSLIDTFNRMGPSGRGGGRANSHWPRS